MSRKMIGFAVLMVLAVTPPAIYAQRPRITEFRSDPMKIATDGAGNVYTLGWSSLNYLYLPMPGNQYQWMTKCDPSGNQVWVKKFTTTDFYFSSFTVDALGNAYLAGCIYYNKGSDILAVKLSSGGNELWRATYNGPANLVDWAGQIAVDTTGNVYVNGYCSAADPSGVQYNVTIKYSSAGIQLWAAVADFPAYSGSGVANMTTDAVGNVYVAVGERLAPGTVGCATIKYNSAGEQQWLARFGSDSSNNYLKGLDVDAAGNVYVAGESWTGTPVMPDYVTIKYGPAGNELWVATYNGPANSYDQLRALAVDAGGNVYVTGSSWQGAGTQCATVKYDPTGSELWVATYSGAIPQGYAYPVALAIDIAGDVVLTTARDSECATVKYDPSGNLLWEAGYRGPASLYDAPAALALDAVGNVYVTGMSLISQFSIYGSWPPLDPSYEAWFFFYYQCSATIKYSSAGEQQWTAAYANVEDMINVLLYYVGNIDAKNGVQGMTAKLEAALASYQEAKSKDYVGTSNQLEAFKNKCDADSQISSNDRSMLKAQADAIIAYLSTKK